MMFMEVPRGSTVATGGGELAVVAGDPLEPYIEGWLNHFTENTAVAYANDLDDFRGWLAEHGGTLAGVRRVHFAAWCDHLKSHVPPGRTRPLAQTTRARRESSVTSFYNYLVEVEALTVSPAHAPGAKRRTRPGTPDKPTPAMTAEQTTRYVAAAAACGPRHQLAAAVLLKTGARASELCGADVGDVQSQGGDLVLVVRRKGGKTDQLILPAGAAVLVGAAIEGREAGEPLITNLAGGRLTRKALASLVEVVGRRAGVPFATSPHVLRTTALNLLIAEGVAVHDAKDFMGHASITTTDGYFRRAGLRGRRRSMAALLDDLVAA